LIIWIINNVTRRVFEMNCCVTHTWRVVVNVLKILLSKIKDNYICKIMQDANKYIRKLSIALQIKTVINQQILMNRLKSSISTMLSDAPVKGHERSKYWSIKTLNSFAEYANILKLYIVTKHLTRQIQGYSSI